MGVPSYFYWLVKKYQQRIIFDHYPEDGGIDYLYLDLNCAIHPAVKTDQMALDAMPEAVWQYLDNIIQQALPKKAVYIAIDGVAPAAKMRQQRCRRYKSVQDQILIGQIKRRYNQKDDSSDIDFNMISPGTEFMINLADFLKQKISLAKTSKYWRKNFKVIFSDASIAGEGEHKIMDHIRTQTKLDDNIVVYGLDSDLIFLCLANFRPKMALFRERQFFENLDDDKPSEQIKYSFLSIDRLRACLIDVFNPYQTINSLVEQKITNLRLLKEFDPHCYQKQIDRLMRQKFYQPKTHDQRLINDYVFLCFLLGNDFLPAIPSLIIKDGGMEQLILVYKLVQAESADFLVESEHEINMGFFKALLSLLSQLESTSLQNQTKARHVRIANYRKSINKTGDKELVLNLAEALADFEYVEDKDPKPLDLGFETDWSTKYYQKVFHIKRCPDDNLIKTIVHAYLTGLKWTWQYYQQTLQNWSWSYPYEHAPLISDVSRYIDLWSTIKLGIDHPVTPLEQLLLILPPQSSHLLPKALAFLMTDPESGLINYYPQTFEIDINYKRYRWQSHPVLPEINRQLLKRLFRLNLRLLEKNEAARNQSGKVILFE